MLARDGAGQRDALELADDRTVNLGLDGVELGHFDPVLARFDAHAMVARLLASLAFETRIAGPLLGIKETLECPVKVDARLSQCDRIKFLKPPILAGFLGDGQELLDVVFSTQRLPVTFVAVRQDVKTPVIRKPHCAELAVKVVRLFGRGVDAYFCGLKQVSAHCYSAYNVRNLEG